MEGKRNPYTIDQFRLAEKHIDHLSQNITNLKNQPDTDLEEVTKHGTALIRALRIAEAKYRLNTPCL